MAINKICETFDKAVADIPDGAIILIGNFAGPGGTPYYLIHALARQGAKNLTIIANTAGGIGLTVDYEDHRILFENGQVKKVIASFPFSTSASKPSPAEKQILAGKVELELVPQGTLAERIRCGGAGIPAPPHLILSARVPCGTSSSSTLPARICFSAGLGFEAEVEKGKLAMTFFTWPFSKSILWSS